MRYILLLLFLVVSILFLDRDMAEYFSHHKLHLFKPITALGNALWYIVPGLGVYMYYRNKRADIAKKGLYLVLSVAISGLITDIIKILVGRPRPKMWIHHHLGSPQWLEFKASFWSMPSGHTTTAFAAGVALGYIFPKYRYLFWAMALLVGVSRVVLAKHYPSDVLVGALIGSLVAWYLHKRMNIA